MRPLEPKHLALWSKANPLTIPSKAAVKPAYSAWHRQKAERVVEREDEPEPPKLDLGGE